MRICIILFFIFPNFIICSHFASKQLHKIYNVLSSHNNINGAQTDTNSNTSHLCIDYSFNDSPIKIVFRKSQANLIEHIGVSLFEERNNIFPDEIYDFIERYFLIILLDDPDLLPEVEDVEMLLEDRPIYKKIKDVLPYLCKSYEKVISFNNNYYEFSIFKTKNDKITLIIPVEYNLILGMDKKESSIFLYEKIINFSDGLKELSTVPLPFNKSKYFLNDSILFCQNDSLYCGIKQTNYFIIANNDTSFLIHPLYPSESINNILTNPEKIPINILVQTEQRLYGSEKKFYEKNLMDIYGALGLFYERYVGIEQVSNDSIYVSVFTVNRYLKILNMLYLKIPKEDIFNQSFLCNAELYGPIRYDNINNIFKEYSITQHNKFKIELYDN